MLRLTARAPLALAAASLPDRHGFFSLGTNADYTASFIGKIPFFLEATSAMPRTFGRNQVHVSQVLGYTVTDRPLLEIPPPEASESDRRIAAYVAEYIRDGDTIQSGIGSIPGAVMSLLHDRRDLGVHTELLSDGLVDLVERGVVTGTRKTLNPGKIVTTFALGTKRVYDFVDENPAVEFWPVDYVNNPAVIGREDDFVTVNATLEVDLLGQCASESIGSRMYSGSGGQSDFARGTMYSRRGRSFIVLHATTSDGKVSRIRPQLTSGAAVTTMKNTVDHVVTEYGVARLRGASLRERAQKLITIAHPSFRPALYDEARSLGML
jgi:acyl-CoA hydrolase